MFSCRCVCYLLQVSLAARRFDLPSGLVIARQSFGLCDHVYVNCFGMILNDFLMFLMSLMMFDDFVMCLNGSAMIFNDSKCF